MLPASAGMILSGCDRRNMYVRAPRICGDDPHPGFIPASDNECSPHLRG